MPSRKTAGRYCGHLEFVAALTRAFPTMIATTTATLANMAADQTTATLATMTLHVYLCISMDILDIP